MPIVVADLTEASLEGQGVFDVLMKASRNHLEQEFKLTRLKGAEYAEVYLGVMSQVLQTSTQFLLQKDQAALQADLVRAQIALTEAQTANEALKGINLGLEGDILRQKLLNAEVENRLLEAQICKLKAEYDLIKEQVLQTTAQTTLVTQKVQTEKAQTVEAGVDDGSVIGKQKNLYQAQADGFKRDAEQKAAKMLIDTWNVRRTTDEGTLADATNMLNDVTIGRAVNKVLQGVNA